MHDLRAAVFTKVNSVASEEELQEESKLEEFFRDLLAGSHGHTCSDMITAGVEVTTVGVVVETDTSDGATVTLGIFTLHADSSSVAVLSLPTSTLPQV